MKNIFSGCNEARAIAEQLAELVVAAASAGPGDTIHDLQAAQQFNALMAGVMELDTEQRRSAFAAIGARAVCALAEHARAVLAMERALLRARVPRDATH